MRKKIFRLIKTRVKRKNTRITKNKKRQQIQIHSKYWKYKYYKEVVEILLLQLKADTVDQSRHSCDDVLMTRSLHDPKMVIGNQGLGNEEGELLSDSASSQMSVSNYHLSGGCTKDHTSDTTSDTASATSGKIRYK